MFEEEWNEFLESQKAGANKFRMEHLEKDLKSTKLMFKNILYPVFQTFDGFVLEKDLLDVKGVRIFVDAYHESLMTCFESEGFVVHAQNVTRERFNFEKRRNRTFAKYRLFYYPITRDDMESDNAEATRREMYAYIGQHAKQLTDEKESIPAEEKPLILHLLLFDRPINQKDVCEFQRCHRHTAREILKRWIGLGIVRPLYSNRVRIHAYRMNAERAFQLFA